jgi:hypothetical protein
LRKTGLGTAGSRRTIAESTRLTGEPILGGFDGTPLVAGA